MDRALSNASRSAAPAAICLILGALPTFMVLHDGVTRAAPNDALWSMPLPVVTTLLAVIVIAARSGDPRAVFVVDPSARLLGLVGLGLVAWAFCLLPIRAVVPAYGVIRLAELALVAALAVALAGAIRSHGARFARSLLSAFVFGMCFAMPLLACARLMEWPTGYGELDVPGFAHIRILGFALALALACAGGLWSENRARPALFLAMAALSTALFWSGGRGALAGLVLPLAVLASVLPALRKGCLPLAAALLIGATAAWFIETGAHQLGLGRRLTELGGSADALTSGRLGMWQTLLAALADAPMLGLGAAQSHWIFADAGHSVAHVHAHNSLLDTALALGWPGTVIAAITVIALWWRWLARARATGSSCHAAGIALVSVFLAISLVDGVYVYWPGLVPFAIGAAVLAGIERSAEPQSRSN
ncbi:MAG: O-antigen ligase family protein [Pseudomonadota bacterium]